MKKLAGFILFHIFTLSANGQAIDYSPAYRAMNAEKSFRFSYENDFFSASDRDYTQGIYMELISPAFKKNPLSRLLWQPGCSSALYGIAVETNGYTPNHIDRENIQFEDRPYASTLLIKWFNTAIRATKSERITNTLTVGVLGPLAGGREIQTAIHSWIGYTRPAGWHNQIANEPVVNYQLNYEKLVWEHTGRIQVNLHGMARAGTLSTKAATGLSVMLGKFKNTFRSIKTNQPFSFYVYDHIAGNLVAYDATLQGGLINRKSPYTISGSEVNPMVLQNRIGMVLIIKTLTLEYWQSFLTREFKTGIEPRTGGLQLGIAL
jgi:lipid A 3-O-deacylase